MIRGEYDDRILLQPFLSQCIENSSELRVGDVIRIAVIALALALVSTLYPAWVAAKTAPAEALRYD